MDNTYDKLFYSEGEQLAGVDEAGVSDIAGPLVAACVVLPKIDLHRDDLRIFEVNDSKQIPEKYRKQHAEVIWQVAVGIGIGEASPVEVDYLGKHNAISLAMLRAVGACKATSGSHKQITPDFILVDGERPIQTHIRQKTIQKGDAKSLSVAAASVVAKVWRDEIMIKLHEKWPEYDWLNNKGYPCENQYQGLDTRGAELGIHRIKSWPFVANPDYKENALHWRQRRYKWRQLTEKRLSAELGERIWPPKEI